jgi:hypothetical protein
MASGAAEASIRVPLEQHKVVNNEGDRVCEVTATVDDLDFRLVSERDDSMAEEQDPSTTSATANDVDDAMETDKDSTTVLRAEDDGAALNNEPSTIPDSMGDLFDDCAAMDTVTQISDEGDNQETQSAGPAVASDGQHQPANPSVTEALETLDPGENRLDPEDLDASTKEGDATPSGSTAIANESANASDATSTVGGPTETQPRAVSSTVGVKRAAPSPTSALPAFSWNDILRVQNLIERCLQQYLTKVRKTPGLLLLYDCSTLTLLLSCFIFTARDLGGASVAGERRSLLRRCRVAEARGAEPVLLPRLPHPTAAQGADCCLQLPCHSAEGDECQASQAPSRANVLCSPKEQQATREHQQWRFLTDSIV